MKKAMLGLACALGMASTGALAQPVDETLGKLQACATLARVERLACLERLSREVAPSAPLPTATPRAADQTQATDTWILSETTSPVDYTPVAIATASAAGPAGTAMRLSIRCSNGRTELLISSESLSGRGENYAVSYAVNGGPPTFLTAGTPPVGLGVAVKGDVVRLLISLPDQGEIAFRVTAIQGGVLEGRYALAAVAALLKRMATPCKWPAFDPPRK